MLVWLAQQLTHDMLQALSRVYKAKMKVGTQSTKIVYQYAGTLTAALMNVGVMKSLGIMLHCQFLRVLAQAGLRHTTGSKMETRLSELLAECKIALALARRNRSAAR